MQINKGVFLLNSNWENFKFDLKRGHGNLFLYFLDRIRWNIFPRLKILSKFPTHIDIELANACNLNCPMCYTTTEEFKNKVVKQIMSLDLFKKIIDECAKHPLEHYSIRLSWRGEPFLNPDILEMVKYAKDKGIKEVSTLTHGGFLPPEKFEEFLEAGLDWISISVDGVDETYDKIRFPLKFSETVAKIKAYHEIKKKHNSVKPVIKVHGVWPAIEESGAEKYINTFKPISDQVAAQELQDMLHNDLNRELIEDWGPCPVLYQRLTIAADGMVKLCYNDEMGLVDVGDANKEGIQQIWLGKKLQKARDLHMKKLGVKELAPCKFCQYPRKITNSEKTTKIGEKKVKRKKFTNRSETIGI